MPSPSPPRADQRAPSPKKARSRSRSPRRSRSPASRKPKSFSGLKWKNDRKDSSERDPRRRDDRDDRRRDDRFDRRDRDSSRRDGDRRPERGGRDDRSGRSDRDRDSHRRDDRDDHRRRRSRSRDRRPHSDRERRPRSDKDKPATKPAPTTTASTGEAMIIVTVNDRLGTKTQVPCLPSDPVKVLKAMVAAKIGRPVHEIMLKRQGERPFHDSLSLADYAISNGVQIDLELNTGD
ncbi:hypothetical protein N0V95_002922 [Ascochyta clinopodiicola]|nr:hypothetical protein N0V95_002922 [Ascochyta clinopodiicola]